jgi:hypothetical protein
MSALDRPLPVTFFADGRARTKTQETVTLRKLAPRVENTRATEKSKLPWLKLATFGDTPTPKGCLRHDANVLSVSGLEGDYDGEAMPMGEAAELLDRAGVGAMLYESPSHRPDAPRWRVLCPLSKDHAPEERKALAEGLNGVLGGVLRSESFALSQSFYFGGVGDRRPKVIFVEGEPIDTLDLPRRPPKGKDSARADGDDSDVLVAIAFNVRRRGGDFNAFDEAWPQNDRAAAHVYKHGSEALQRRAVERAWAYAEKHADPGFNDLEDDEPKRQRRADLEFFWGDADDGGDDLEPLVDGFLHQRALASVYGKWGEGKSFVMIDLALHIAIGRPWFGREVAQGPVVYFAPEGYVGLKRRRAAWCKHHRLDRTPEDFALVRGSLNLQRPDGVTVEALAAEARRRGAKLIIVDTLNAVFGGADENDSAAMSKARHELERLRDLSGATVIVVHHAGKDVSRGLRGSSVLGGALDSILLIDERRIISTPPKGKQKDLEPAADIPFALATVDLAPDRRGRPVSSAVVIPRGSERFENMEAKDMKLADVESEALSTLQRLTAVAAILDAENSVSLEAWRRAFYALPRYSDASGDTKRNAFNRTRAALAEKQLIQEAGERVEIV